jgi:hypothetical protein
MDIELRRFVYSHVKDDTPPTPGSEQSETSAANQSETASALDNGRGSNPRFAPYWKQLPWEIYLGNRDFLQIVKALEAWWSFPADEQARLKQRDWLSMAMMFQQ